MKSRIPVMAFLFTGIAGSFVVNPAYAERYVIVNGHFLSSAQIQRLEMTGGGVTRRIRLHAANLASIAAIRAYRSAVCCTVLARY
jgi:hypothetical protein